MNDYAKTIKDIFQKNKLPNIDNIEEIKSGKVNKIFSVNDKFVIKFALQPGRGFDKEAIVLDQIKGIPLAPLIAVEEKYIIQEKLKGTNMAYVWPELNDIEKENLFSQLVEIFKIMHSHHYPVYGDLINKENQFSTWRQCFGKHFQDATNCAVKSGFVSNEIIEKIKNYYQNNIHVLDDEILKPSFCHTDLIFSNILVDNGKISGILDFDLSLSAPFDFEFEIPLSFFKLPQFFMPDNVKNKYQKPLTECFVWLKKYYSEIYQIKNITKRLDLYSVAGNMFMIYLCDIFGYDNSMKQSILQNLLSTL